MISLGIAGIVALSLLLTGCADSDLENANLEELESRVSVLEDRAEGLAQGEEFLLERLLDVEFEIMNDVSIEVLGLASFSYLGTDTYFWELYQKQLLSKVEKLKIELSEDPDNVILIGQIELLESKIKE